MICSLFLLAVALVSGGAENPRAFEKVAENGYCPCWSPDGQYLIFGGTGPSWNIGKVDIRVKKTIWLTSNRGYHPAVSPDNRFIIFDSRGAMGILQKIGFGDGKPQRLVSTNIAGNFSCWSPDGKNLVYSRGGKLWKLELESGNELELYSMPAPILRSAWSRDGFLIAFDAGNPSVTGNLDIFIIDAEGKNPKQLTDNPKIDSQPDFSPDGKWIAFMSDQNGNKDIWLMKTDGSRKIRLTDDPGVDVWPRWSPDGTKIAFGSQRHENAGSTFNIWIVNLEKQLGKDFFE